MVSTAEYRLIVIWTANLALFSYDMLNRFAVNKESSLRQKQHDRSTVPLMQFLEKLVVQPMRSIISQYGIVEFNVPLDTLQIISETILRVRWPNQQCHSIEGRWLVNQLKGQSHQAQLTNR